MSQINDNSDIKIVQPPVQNDTRLNDLLIRYQQEIGENTLSPDRQLLLTEFYLKDLALKRDMRNLTEIEAKDYLKYFTLGYYLYQFIEK